MKCVFEYVYEFKSEVYKHVDISFSTELLSYKCSTEILRLHAIHSQPTDTWHTCYVWTEGRDRLLMTIFAERNNGNIVQKFIII